MLQKISNAAVIKSFFCIVIASCLSGCQNTTPKPDPNALDPEQFVPKIYPMSVRGLIFSMNVPLVDGESLQQQQNKIFTSISEEDTENQTVHKYVKVSKIPDTNSAYILRSGLQVHSSEHLYDTFLEYKISGSCKPEKIYLHCEYRATEGLYSVDLPPVMSLNANQTPAQMEENEITILSKLNFHPLNMKKKFSSPYNLQQLKSKFIKRNFIVKYEHSILSLIRPQYDYVVELTQEKTKSDYLIIANIQINPKKIDSYSTDFVKSYNQVLEDLHLTTSR